MIWAYFQLDSCSGCLTGINYFILIKISWLADGWVGEISHESKTTPFPYLVNKTDIECAY